MSGVSNFYIFISRNVGFENFKEQADTNNNGVIQFNELYSYVKHQSELSSVTDSEIREIWRGLDEFIKGNNSNASGNVSENGSLNSSEEAILNSKINLYGVIDGVLGSVLQEFSGVLNSTNYPAYHIDYDTLYYTVADAMVKANGVAEMNEDQLKELARTKTVSSVKELIIDQVVNDAGFKSALSNAGFADYDLEGDEDLRGLINQEVSKIFQNNEDPKTALGQIGWRVAIVIKLYIKSADIAYQGTTNNYNLAEWNNASGMNSLQKAAVIKGLGLKLDSDGKYDGIDYTGFESEFNQLAQDFISGISNNFDNVNFDNLKAQFSQKLTTLKNYVQLKNLELMDSSYYENLGDWRAWNNVASNAENNTNPAAILTSLHLAVGIPGKYIVAVYNTPTFQGILDSVYAEKPDNMYEFIKRVTEKLKNPHTLETVMMEAGITDKADMVSLLYQNALSSTQGYDAKGTFTLEEKKSHINQYLQFITANYNMTGELEKAIADLQNKMNTESNWGNGSTNADTNAVLTALKKVKDAAIKAGLKVSEEDDNPIDAKDINAVAMPISAGIEKVGMGEEYQECSFSIDFSQPLNRAAISAVNSQIDVIKSKLLQEGFDSDLLTKAAQYTKDYFEAVLSILKNKSGNGECNDWFSTGNFTYKYMDANGNEVEVTDNLQYTHSTNEGSIQSAVDDAKPSPSGIYVYEQWDHFSPNNFGIGVDRTEIWNKFKFFYNKLCGK